MAGKLTLVFELTSKHEAEEIEIAARQFAATLSPHASVKSKVTGFREPAPVKPMVECYSDEMGQRLVLKINFSQPKYFVFPNIYTAPLLGSEPNAIPFIVVRLDDGRAIWGYSKDRFMPHQMETVSACIDELKRSVSNALGQPVTPELLGWLTDDGFSDYRGGFRNIDKPLPAYKQTASIDFTVRLADGSIVHNRVDNVNNYWDVRRRDGST